MAGAKLLSRVQTRERSAISLNLDWSLPFFIGDGGAKRASKTVPAMPTFLFGLGSGEDSFLVSRVSTLITSSMQPLRHLCRPMRGELGALAARTSSSAHYLTVTSISTNIFSHAVPPVPDRSSVLPPVRLILHHLFRL